MTDADLYNDTEETDKFGIVRTTRTRLIRYTDKKDQFLWWSIDCATKIDTEKSNPAGLMLLHTFREGRAEALAAGEEPRPCDMVAESGIFDFTPLGVFFGLNETQRNRALTKRIPRPTSLGIVERSAA